MVRRYLRRRELPNKKKELNIGGFTAKMKSMVYPNSVCSGTLMKGRAFDPSKSSERFSQLNAAQALVGFLEIHERAASGSLERTHDISVSLVCVSLLRVDLQDRQCSFEQSTTKFVVDAEVWESSPTHSRPSHALRSSSKGRAASRKRLLKRLPRFKNCTIRKSCLRLFTPSGTDPPSIRTRSPGSLVPSNGRYRELSQGL
jgi:hypothetical protein